MCFNCALAWHCPYGDVRRIFGQGTPKEVLHLMGQTRTAAGVPTNAGITEGILGWERVCDHRGQGNYCPRRELSDRPPLGR